MAEQNVRTILVDWLGKNGYDGLCAFECSCDLGDLLPCDGADFVGCVPGYKVKCSDCTGCPNKEDYDHCVLNPAMAKAMAAKEATP